MLTKIIMNITKEEFKEEFAREYFEIGVNNILIPENIKFACENYKNYYRIAQNVTGAMSSGNLRLLIGQLLTNFEYSYNGVVDFFIDDNYMKYLKEQYFLYSKEKIGYDIYECAEYDPNPYWDLIKMEKYLSVLLEQDEAVEEELITLYNNVIEFNKLSLEEKEKSLKSFFCNNYKFSEWVSEKRDVLGDLFSDYNSYNINKEMFESCKNGIYARINIYENECKNFAIHHEKMHLEILNVLNRIKNVLEKDVVDLEELMKCKAIIENEIEPMYDIYWDKACKHIK